MKNNQTRSSEHHRLFAHIFFALGFLTFSYMVGMLLLKDLGKADLSYEETMLLLCATVAELAFGQRLLTRSQNERFVQQYNRKGERCAR
jgi:cytochrome c oxidase assembly factor CtaG